MSLNFDTEQFLREHWQRRPIMLGQALPGFESPINGDDLAAIAGQPSALSRLIRYQRRTDRWRLQHGPFEAADFAGLPARDWTLLVQDVDKWLPQEVGNLLEHFDFLPRWRIEDLMVSYAVAGGSVGPHTDQYDVFLLQAAGQRRWQIDTRSAVNADLVSGAPLKLLKHFEPDQEWVLRPGDMLYLPPGVPHHGVAVDECLTFSIGLRAPSGTELLQAVAATLLERSPDAQRYSDRGLDRSTYRGELNTAAMQRLRECMRSALENQDDLELASTLGRFVSGYRAARPLSPRHRPLRPASLDQKLSTDDWELQPDPWQRLCWTQQGSAALLHSAERSQLMPIELAEQLCLGRAVRAPQWRAFDSTARASVHQLYADGILNLQRCSGPLACD